MMKQINVLIADNSNEFTGLHSQFLALNADNNIVGIANDGVEAIDLLAQTKPDVLLLDLVMPSLGDEEMKKKTFEAGADSFLCKAI